MSKQNRSKPHVGGRIYMARTVFVLIVIALCFGIVGGVKYFLPQKSVKTYKSDFMKIQFDYPVQLTVEDDLSGVILNNLSTKGRILMSKYGTNFEYVHDHVDLAISRWKDKPTTRENFTGLYQNGEIVGRISDERITYKIYFFVKNYSVYQFETNDPSLFADLDAIVKTFRIVE